MKTQSKFLTLAAAAAVTGLVALPVFADPSGHQGGHQGGKTGPHSMQGQGMGHGGMGHGMKNAMQGRKMGMGARFQDTEALKKAIGITEEQEEAWDTYAKVLKNTVETMRSRRAGVDHDAVRAMSDADRQAFRAAMQKQGQETHATLKAAAEKLIESLEDEQKAKAKQTLPGLKDRAAGQKHAGKMGGGHERGGMGAHSGPMNSGR
ncbi:MAG: Spy/CpxP family protein refolding chaperone [Rhodospirillales bacterium]